MNFIKSILIKIRNLFIIIFRYIFTFLVSIFKTENNSSSGRTTTKNQNEKKESKFIPTTNVSPVDEESHLTLTKDSNVEKKVIDLKSLKYEKELLEDLISDIVDKRLSEETKLHIDYIYKKSKEELKEYKKKISPDLIYNINHDRIETYEKLSEKIKEIVKEDLKKDKEQKILLEEEKRKPKKKKKSYFIATPLPQKINLPNKVEITKDYVIKETTIKEKDEIIETIQTQNYFIVPTEEQAKLELKDEINNILLGSALVLSSITKELVGKTNDKKNKETKNNEIENVPIEEEKEVSKENILTEPEIIKDQEEIKDVDTIEEPISEEVNKPEKKVIEKEIVKQKDEKIEEEKIEEEKVEKIEEQQYYNFDLRPIEKSTIEIIEESKVEFEKEDLDDKEYDELEYKINKMLEEIELFFIRNEKILSPKQKQQLRKEQQKLRLAKENIKIQKYEDIKKEQEALVETFALHQIDKLKKELKKMNIENQIDLNNQLISKVEDLNNMNKDRVAEIEKKLIKTKIKKASRCLEIPSIIALPFIRNKFFAFFTAGLFVNNHFHFINSIFKRKTEDPKEPELDNLKKGKDALNKSLNLTVENLYYLDYLEQEILTRYPELYIDNEYLYYIAELRAKLNNSYIRLMKKKERLSKTQSKAKKNIKALKKTLKKTQ